MTTLDSPAVQVAPAEPPPPGVRTPMSWLMPGTQSAWPGRGAFVGFALLLLIWPSVIGDPTELRQWAEWLCYAMIAVGLDIAWGYGGMLVLGQGLFFGLGAYAMGMHLTLEQVDDGELPSFMSLYGSFESLPLLWRPFDQLWFAVLAAVLVPMLLAGGLGLLVFKRRIRGAFFALLTQATAVIFVLVLVGNLPLTAGANGLTSFSTVFGRNRYAEQTNIWLFQLASVALLIVLAIAMGVVRSRYGKLLQATRDSEDRVRYLGYDPAVVKTIGFVIAAGMAGLAGAVAAPVFGIVSPGQFDYVPSLLMICWVAVGGRGAIWGAVLGALLVNWLRVNISDARPDDWQYAQGALFLLVLAFAPGGLTGLLRSGYVRAFGLPTRRPKQVDLTKPMAT